MKTRKVTRIAIEFNDEEALILAKVLGNVAGDHEWRAFLGTLYAELVDHVGDEYYGFGHGVIKQEMVLGDSDAL